MNKTMSDIKSGKGLPRLSDSEANSKEQAGIAAKMNVTEALLRAILELIDKCESIEELRASVKRVMDGEIQK